ncbi:MAG: hypothetical protein Q8Q88_19530 [Phenylobacterium sp.]|uniref:hypothetical protein n=1 Tax=Phenylobacterium sp. TaxID=1871053 RepID=UPI002732324A|nr:hypothetical protein [Phenylobacterium sp.]MDP3749233.1 hypothetical protein [Phenylobacterium sp.]
MAGALANHANDKTSELVAKANAVAQRFDVLKAAHARAQADEALTRSRLSLALSEALAEQGEIQRRLRAEVARGYRLGRASQARRRRRNRAARLVDRLLVKLRSIGRAAVIARSGLWPPSGVGVGASIADLKAMAAYARRGPVGSIATPTLLDHDWYLASYPDVAQGRLSPLVHYIVAGGREGRAPSPLFDPAFYIERNGAEIGATGLTPLEHFVHMGAALGRDPHPLFSIAYYVAQCPDLIEAIENPLAHYLRTGWRQGLSPHPLFSVSFYSGQVSRGERDTPGLVHYLKAGSRRGLKPHPLFDPNWYRTRNPDVADAGLEPLSHFVVEGWRQGRSPSAWFDPSHYAALRGEELLAETNPLLDYLEGGAWRVGEARPGFPTAAYVAATPSLIADRLTPLEHWATRGSASR